MQAGKEVESIAGAWHSLQQSHRTGEICMSLSISQAPGLEGVFG